MIFMTSGRHTIYKSDGVSIDVELPHDTALTQDSSGVWRTRRPARATILASSTAPDPTFILTHREQDASVQDASVTELAFTGKDLVRLVLGAQELVDAGDIRSDAASDAVSELTLL